MGNLVSVVVPVWNVQGYLAECLDSILVQPAASAEVIGVDDASTDHGGEMLDERAAVDPRLITIHLPATVGPGPARNAGLERASGEYVWFVDADDYIAPGALVAVEAALVIDKPDVLVVGTARERWNRSVSAWTNPSTRPLPLGALVIRRAFLAEAGIAFGPGWHEDVGFVASVLARADRVGAYAPACYIHRPDRPGSIGNRRSARHADLVDQLEHALSLTGEPQALDRAVDEVLALLRDGKRLPESERAGVFGRLSRLVRAHGGGSGLKQRMIARGSYPAYRMFFERQKVKGFLKARRKRRDQQSLDRYYQRQLRRPIDEHLAVYAAYWYRGYACNPAAIYEKARELAPGVRGVWVVKPGVSVPAGVETVQPGTKAYYRALARAKYLINNATFPPEVVKRPGAVHVQTHHGTPLKTMGLDQPRFPASRGRFDPERLRRDIANWDFSVTANRHTTLLWDRQFPIKGETLETGYPRNDRLARAGAAETAAARAELGIGPDERVILYAPTHREWHATFTPVLDVDALAEALGPDTRILLRGHYFYGGLGIPPRSPQVVDVSAHPSVETLMIASDALMTDFSSIMFDYAVLDRPLVIYAPDWEIYQAVRGVTFDLSAEHPGTFARSFDELVEAFRSGAVAGPEAAADRARFRERFCSLEDGNAAARVVRRVFLHG